MKIPEKKRSRFRRRRTVPKKPVPVKAAPAKPTAEKLMPEKSVPEKPLVQKATAQVSVQDMTVLEKSAVENSGYPTQIPAAKGFCIRCPLLGVALLVILLLAVLFCSRPLRNSWPQSELPGYFAAVQSDGRIDLNRADAAALRTLPGIGESRAAAILAWREEHGGFSCVEELLQIPGIGEKMLETLRDAVCVLPME